MAISGVGQSTISQYSNTKTLPQDIQNLLAQLSPAEQQEFQTLLQQIFPQTSGSATTQSAATQSIDSFLGSASSVTNGAVGATGIDGFDGKTTQDFAKLLGAILNDLNAATPAPSSSSTSGAAGASGVSGVAGSSGAAGVSGAAGASGAGGTYQSYYNKAVSELSNVATYQQGLADWAKANAAWQAGGATGGATGVTGAVSTSGSSTSGATGVTGAVSTSGSSTSGSSTSGSSGATVTSGQTTGILHQPSSKVWTKAGVEAAQKNTVAGFPSMDQWQSFDAMWAKAEPMMLTRGNTAQENGWIKDSIQDESQKTGVDPRIILADMMQESGGQANINTTNNGVRNPGLMQSYNGATFDPNNPEASIKQMVKDGVEGTWDQAGGGGGIGLADCIQQAGSVWAGLRMYNSGSVDLSNLSSGLGATPLYVQQMAHKLQDLNFSS